MFEPAINTDTHAAMHARVSSVLRKTTGASYHHRLGGPWSLEAQLRGYLSFHFRSRLLGELLGNFDVFRGQVAIDWTQRSNGVTYDGSRYNDYRPITFVTKYNARRLNDLLGDAIQRSKKSSVGVDDPVATSGA